MFSNSFRARLARRLASLPGSRLNVSTKVYLAFGGILMLCITAQLLVFAGLVAIDRLVERIASVDAPLSAAAYELEIDAIGIGMGVMKYLDEPDPQHRQRVAKAHDDFRRFRSEYDRLAGSEEGRRLGDELDALQRDFVSQGQELMNRQDELEAHLSSFGQAMRLAVDLVHREVNGGKRDPRLMELASKIAEIGQWLGFYLHDRNAVYLDLIGEGRLELARVLAALDGATDKEWRADVGRLAEQGLREADAVIGLQQSRDRDVQRFIQLRRSLDDLLDEGIQKLIERDALDARGAADSTTHQLIAVSVAMCLLLLAVGALAAWALVRTYIQPVIKLAEGVAAVAAGGLDHQIEHDTGDEFGELARAFNRMAGELLDSRTGLERRVEERTRELAHLASHDVLTGLANRNGLLQRLDGAVKSARRRGEKLGLLLLDLDGFKDVNDTRGHDEGDRLLREVARRLRGQVREVDIAARLGGDEFCVVLTNVDDHARAAAVAERCLNALAAAVSEDGEAMSARGSIGIALYPDDGEEPNDLLKAADTAMYVAKRAGKHRFAFYAESMTREVEQQIAIESALRAGVERGEFELHYQPQVVLKDGRMRGVEALLRWRHPERGLVLPNEFIPVAERIGLIDALGEWVLRTACHQASAWRAEGLDGLVMSVNISPGHFASPGFVEAVARVLRDTGLAPSRLEIEVTESLARDGRLHATVSGELRKLGVSVTIDDFGTGYSSLTVLKQMPINMLKLDRQFIHDMLDDSESSVLVGAIIGMAKGLNVAVLAEGVETLEQVQVLKGLGCQLAQGYFFSRPATADAIPALARRNYLVDTKARQPAEAIFPLSVAQA